MAYLRNLFAVLLVSSLPFMVTAQTITVTDTNFVGTYPKTNVPTVRALAKDGAGASHACLPLLQINRDTFYRCYSGGLITIDGQGKTYRLEENGEIRLFENVDYIVPVPLTFGLAGQALLAAQTIEARADEIVKSGLSPEDIELLASIPALSERLTAIEEKVEAVAGNVSANTENIAAQSTIIADQAVRLTELETFRNGLNLDGYLSDDDLQRGLIDAGLLDSDGKPLVGLTVDQRVTLLTELRQSLDSESTATPDSEIDMVVQSDMWLYHLLQLVLGVLALLGIGLIIGQLFRRKESSKTEESAHPETSSVLARLDDPKTGLGAAHTKADQALKATSQNAVAIEALASLFNHKVRKIEEGKQKTLAPVEIKKLKTGDEFIYHVLVDDQHVAFPAKVERKTDKGDAVVVIQPYADQPPLKVGTKNLFRSLSDKIEEHGLPDALKASEPNAVAAE